MKNAQATDHADGVLNVFVFDTVYVVFATCTIIFGIKDNSAIIYQNFERRGVFQK